MSTGGEPPPAFPFADRLVAWQKEGRSTDVLVESNEEDEAERQQFLAHSFLLSLASPVLERMLETNMQEGRERRIVLPFSRDVVRRAVHYFYRGPASLEWPEHGSDARLREKAMQNLGIADYLQCEELRSECERWMVDDVDSDPHYYFDHACFYRLPAMETAAWKEMADHSDCYFGRGGFVKLCYERFKKLMKDVRAYFMQTECHDGVKESMLYIDTVKWIAHNKPTEERATSLLSLLRFNSLHPTFLVDVVGQEPIVQGNPACLGMFMKAVADVVNGQHAQLAAVSTVSNRTLSESMGSAPPNLFIHPCALNKQVKNMTLPALVLIVLWEKKKEMNLDKVIKEVSNRFGVDWKSRVWSQLKKRPGLVERRVPCVIKLGPRYTEYGIAADGQIDILKRARGRS